MMYCDRCDRYFRHEGALEQHIRDSNSHCSALKEHYVQSPCHAYCQYCNEHFHDYDDLRDHYKDKHNYCHSCDRVFKNGHGLNEHLCQFLNHNYCIDCQREFVNPNALWNHLNSSVHSPKNVNCPFNSCQQSFVSISTLILHFELEGATQGLTVQAYITDPSCMLTNGEDDTTITYHATSTMWNGYSYECYLCYNMFCTLSALDQHLASLRHQDKIYFCQRVIALLLTHIESGKCGVSRFKRVQNLLNNVLKRVLSIEAW
ncbi:hypothetical protein BDQ17DRAFT_1394452 [Cyathus striatus]|nr:hypothetical protein BDQ17DRAFT_1394452 [Cyathus striatus]